MWNLFMIGMWVALLICMIILVYMTYEGDKCFKYNPKIASLHYATLNPKKTSFMKGFNATAIASFLFLVLIGARIAYITKEQVI